MSTIRGRYSVAINKGLWVMQTSDLMMLDWDVNPNASEETDCHYTVRSKGEAVRALEKFCKRNPNCLFRVYETPSGIHAFLVSHKMPVWYRALNLGLTLGADNYYMSMCMKRGAWSYRIEPKKGRKGDYVARFLCWVGKGVADPYLAQLMKKHDNLIELGIRGQLAEEGDSKLVTYKTLVR